MNDFVTILTTPGKRLAKIIRDSGEMIPYDDAAYFQHMRLPVGNIDTLYAQLEKLRTRSDSCIIRGSAISRADSVKVTFEDGKEPVKGGLYRRRLEMFPDVPHQWFMLDVDDETWTGSSVVEGLEAWVRTNLPVEFHDVSFVWHLSSSAGIKPGLRAHLWFWLRTAYDSRASNEWAKAWNASQGRRVLDTSIYNAVQVHYTADPIVDDPFGMLELPAVRMGLYRGFMGDDVDISFEPTNGPNGPTGGTKEEIDEFDLLNQTQPLDDIDEDAARAYLERIDNEDGEGLAYDDWIKVGMALKHQFGDAGLELFHEFSQRSAKYDEKETEKKWRSFQAHRRNAATFASVIHMAGGRIKPETEEEVKVTVDDLTAEIEACDNPEVLTGKIPRKIAHAGLSDTTRELLLDKCRKRVKTLTGTLLPKSRFTAPLKDEAVKGKALDDLHLELGLARRIIDAHFPDGRIKAIGGNFWLYENGVWALRDDSIVRKYAFDAITELLDAGAMEDKFAEALAESDRTDRVSALVDAIVKVIKDRTTEVAKDPLGLMSAVTKPVINCTNGELWFRPNGDYDFKRHNPKHNLTQQIACEFDEDAECPTWDLAVQRVFKGVPNHEAVIAYWYELLGYMIQPTRDAGEAWMLMKGPGGNGKSFLMEIIQTIMGEACLEQQMAELSKGYDTHFTADLLGKLMLVDDDFKAKGLLPDDWMKKLTGQKIMSANPKYQRRFNFVCRAMVVILSNGWPATADTSGGMQRRANVFEVNHILTDDERDPSHRKTIIEKELPGVLNRLVQGWQRVLRNGGKLRPPAFVIASNDKWLQQGSSALRFVRQSFERGDPGDRVTFKEAWSLYKHYVVAYDEGTRQVSRESLKEVMLNAGMKVSRIDTDQRTEVYEGWRIAASVQADIAEASGL